LEHLIAATIAIVKRLQLNNHAAVILHLTPADDAGEPDHSRDRRILADFFNRLPHQRGHPDERHVLARVELAEDETGVLLWKEALGYLDVEETGDDDQHERREQRGELMPKHPVEPTVVAFDHPLEEALGR